MTGFQEASVDEITLHGDDPDALETILRYLYGFDDDSPPKGELGIQTIHKVKVIITADKYCLGRKFTERVKRSLGTLVSELDNPSEIMDVLETCTVGSEIHHLLGSVVEDILRLHMPKLVDLPEWYDWTHSVPSVNKKISEESAQMKLLEWGPAVLCCDECGEAVLARPSRHELGCECAEGEWTEFSIRSLLP